MFGYYYYYRYSFLLLLFAIVAMINKSSSSACYGSTAVSEGEIARWHWVLDVTILYRSGAATSTTFDIDVNGNQITGVLRREYTTRAVARCIGAVVQHSVLASFTVLQMSHPDASQFAP